MVKIFYTMRDTQSYRKKRRWWREIEMSKRRKRGDSRGERQIYTVLCSQSVLVAQTPTEIHRIGLGREGGGRK